MDRGEGSPEGQESALVELARYSGHGLTLALSMGLFMLAGWWVDGKAGSTPLFTILGALLGAGAGFYYILQHLLFLPRRREEEERRRDADDREGGARGNRGSHEP